MIPLLNKKDSEARVLWLRAHGWKVNRVKLRDGSIVVLKTKAKQTKVCHQCGKRKRRRRKPPKRFRW